MKREADSQPPSLTEYGEKVVRDTLLLLGRLETDRVNTSQSLAMQKQRVIMLKTRIDNYAHRRMHFMPIAVQKGSFRSSFPPVIYRHHTLLVIFYTFFPLSFSCRSFHLLHTLSQVLLSGDQGYYSISSRACQDQQKLNSFEPFPSFTA